MFKSTQHWISLLFAVLCREVGNFLCFLLFSLNGWHFGFCQFYFLLVFSESGLKNISILNNMNTLCYHTRLISINEMLGWELFNRKFWCFLHHSTQVYMFIHVHVKQTYCWSRCFSIFSWCLLDSRSVNTFWVSSSSERVFSFSYIIIKRFQKMVEVLSQINTNSTDNMNPGTTCTYVY